MFGVDLRLLVWGGFRPCFGGLREGRSRDVYSFLLSPLRSRLRMLVAGERSDDVVLLLGEFWLGWLAHKCHSRQRGNRQVS